MARDVGGGLERKGGGTFSRRGGLHLVGVGHPAANKQRPKEAAHDTPCDGSGGVAWLRGQERPAGRVVGCVGACRTERPQRIRDVPKRRHTSASTALHCGHRGSRERKGCAAIGFDASLDAAVTWRTSCDDLQALSPLQALGLEIAV